ncbi:MAG: hypothetical protein Q8M66_06665, partial [Actinomycetota bacterium]|nr:hypothetical protein [Actinomycetota bacterium]
MTSDHSLSLNASRAHNAVLYAPVQHTRRQHGSDTPEQTSARITSTAKTGVRMFFFFLPYRIERSRWNVPWITIAIIALNIAVFASTSARIDAVAQSFGFTMSPGGLYTWFTSMFLHA